LGRNDQKHRIEVFQKELFAERETRDGQGNVDPRAVTYRLLTPAKEAGIAGRPWSLSDLLSA
jgi:hypothetical protein